MQVSCQYSGHEFIVFDKGSPIVTFCKQSCVLTPVSTFRFVNVPEPAGIVPPENENAITKLLAGIAEDITIDASAAAPPVPPVTIAPSTSN